MKYQKEEIANHIGNSLCGSIKHSLKTLNRIVVLVDSEKEKIELMTCIESTIKQGFKQVFPNYQVCLFRIDLSNVTSIDELYDFVFQRIYACQSEQIKSSFDFPLWLENFRKETGALGDGIRLNMVEPKEDNNYGYGLFIFDNLDKANENVLNGVIDMYHDGRDCIIPLGWDFISFCRHDAKIWDIRFRISSSVYDYDG